MTVKQRHGCLTVYLILMILVASLGVIINFYVGITFDSWKKIASASQDLSGTSQLTFIMLGLLGILHVVFSISLLRWKKWGFYGALGVCVAIFVINISTGISLGESLRGLAGIAILYGVLHIGGENRGWDQLE